LKWEKHQNTRRVLYYTVKAVISLWIVLEKSEGVINMVPVFDWKGE